MKNIETTRSIIVELALTFGVNASRDESAILKWINSCLNCNTNHMQVAAKQVETICAPQQTEDSTAKVEQGADEAAQGNVARLLKMLGKADAVTVDNGPLLTSWNLDDIVGDMDNGLVRYTWTEDGMDFSCTLDEGGIAEGHFQEDGVFVCQDNEDETTEIRMFSLVPLRN